jgi:hypothetical protein
MGSLVDRLVARSDKPLATLADELKREIANERDTNLRIGSVERRILEAARTGRIKLIAEQNGKAPFLEIPARQFEYKMAVHLPSGSITVSYDSSMEDHFHTADVTYERVRIGRRDVEALWGAEIAAKTSTNNKAFAAPDWNLVQAIAWVFARNRELVAAPNLDSTIAVPAWLVAHNRPQPELTIDQAREELQAALRRSAVTATGFRNGTGDRLEIPAAAWADLRLNDGTIDLNEADPWRPGATQWTDVRIDSAKALVAFPEPMRPTNLEIWQDDEGSQLIRVTAGIAHLIELSGGKVCGTKTYWHTWLCEGIAPEGFSRSTFEKLYWKLIPDEHKTQAPRKVESPFPKTKNPPIVTSNTSRTDSTPPAGNLPDFGTRAERTPQKAK